MKPLMIWFTRPLDPNVTIRPRNTLTPLNASVWLPGRYGYATTIAKTHRSPVSSRRVGCAVSG